MSWSIELNGTPDEVVAALQEYAATLSGQTRVEYNSALPHLIGLVRQTFMSDQSAMVELSANGTGLGVALPTLSAWAPGYTTTTVERRGIFGRRMFSAVSVCGPGGCP